MRSEDFYEEAFFTGKMMDRAVRWCQERDGNVIDVLVQGIWRKSGDQFRGKGRLLKVYSHFLKKYVVLILDWGRMGKESLKRGTIITVGGARSKCDVQALNLVFRNMLKKSTSPLVFFDGSELSSAVKWVKGNLPLRRIHCIVEGVWLRSGVEFSGEGEVLVAEKHSLKKFLVMHLERGVIGGREIGDVIVSVGSRGILRSLELLVRSILVSFLNSYFRKLMGETYLVLSRLGLSVFLDGEVGVKVRRTASSLINAASSILSRRTDNPGVDVVASKMLLEPRQEVALRDDYVLRVRGLTVSYGKKVVLKDVSFSLREGEILGIVGESGSGKSTCMKALIGELTPDSGEVLICGFPPSRKDVVSPLIGYVPQDLSRMYENFTPMENIVYFGRQYGISEDELIRRGKRILKELEVFTKGNEKVETLSGGEKRRVSIAIALVHYPKILFLDEPTSGLDLVRRHELWGYLEKINRTYGTTLVVITHYPSEAEYCDKVAVFIKDKGFVDFGTPKELISKLPGSGYAIGLVLEEDDPEVENIIKTTEGVSYVFRIGPYYKILVRDEDSKAILKRIMSRLSSRGIKVFKVEPRVEVTFEDYFRYITGEG